ncbi:hypothetical protein OG453_36540 [Streptomyces sp. NBC_01381]|uniref:hypothetical protein n=1 Tax=Streptomyces sp. NBC_01381 TaxID=2903845 RepID=UPI00224E9944|nr:hypothetical protein [Streptomyces sp. NBC_01381]MCX4672120.1 hypothetical protein [Streptomyces sp. NBC_01381]
MRYRNDEAPYGRWMDVRDVRRLVLDRQAQWRQRGDIHFGPLGRLPEATFLEGVLPAVVSVTAARPVGGVMLVRGTRGAWHGGGVPGVDDLRRDAFCRLQVTHRRIGARRMGVQQTEEDQAKAKETQRSR